MSFSSRATRILFGGLVAGLTATTGLVEVAQAQDGAAMTCGQLWYARNAIYARNGYCFKTERGRAVFGPGCFPPYGALSRSEQERVNELQYWEREKGC